MPMTPEQARDMSLGAVFLMPTAGSYDDPDRGERPCVHLPDDRQVYVYYDKHGVLTVSLHLDGDRVEGDLVPTRITVSGVPVYEEIPDLPRWDELSDLDKGAALMHHGKAESEGDHYATEEYAAEFFDHPRLTELGPDAASSHARQIVGEVIDELPDGEYEQLYDLALNADRKRMQEGQR